MTTTPVVAAQTGRKQALNLEPTDTVVQVKQQLQEKEGIQVDQIRLIYSGKQVRQSIDLLSWTLEHQWSTRGPSEDAQSPLLHH